MKRTTYYKKLLITFYAVIIVYTLITVMVFFYYSKVYNEKEVHQSNHIFLEQIRNKMDDSVGVSVGLMRQMVSSAEVVRYVTADELEYHNVLLIYEQIRDLTVPFDHIGLIFGIGQKDNGMIITSQGTVEEDRFYEGMNFSFSDKEGLYDYLDNHKYVSESGRSSIYDNQEIVTVIASQRFSTGNEMIGYMSFYRDILLPELNTEQVGVIYAVSGQQIVTSRMNGIEVADFEEVNRDFEAYIAGVDPIVKGYNIYKADSQVIDWSYYYISPNHVQRSLLRRLMAIAGVILLFSLLAGAVISFIIVKKTYRPINRVLSYFEDDADEELVNEFDIIENASRRMKRSNEQLKEIILSEKEPLRDKFLRDLLFGINKKDNFETNMEKFDLEIFENKVRVMILQYSDLQELDSFHGEKEIRSVRSHIDAILYSSLEKIEDLLWVEVDHKKVAVIYLDEDNSRLISLMEDTLAMLEAEYNIKVVASVGNMADSIRVSGLSYSHALKNLDFSSVKPDVRIIVGEVSGKSTYYYPLDMEQNLISYLLAGKEEEASMVLDHILVQNIQEMKIENEALALFAFGLTATVNRVLYQINKTVEEVYGEGVVVYLELRNITDRRKFYDKAEQLFARLSEEIGQSRESLENNKLANRILDYIHENYAHDISLNEIAEYFEVTPAYISMLFKKEHGYNFKDYLNMYRIGKVKAYIKQHPETINSVLANVAGFNSVNTFLRVFKKYEGISPGKYSEIINENR